MNITLGTYVIVALVLVIGVVGLSLCADALDAECGHLCCSGASHSAPLERSVRRALAVLAASAAFALPMFVLSSPWARSTLKSVAPSITPLRLSPLRI